MRILIYPNSVQGNGTGHKYRALKIKEQCSEMLTVDILNKEEIRRHKCNTEDIILFDQRETSSEDYLFFKNQALFALDEGGAHRQAMDYLIDTLPNLKNDTPNIQAFHRKISTGKQGLHFPPKKILISFGGADEKDLSSLAIDFLQNSNFTKDAEISLVQGPQFSRKEWPKGIGVLKNLDDLSKAILASDLVLTHFGLSCFESLYMGVPVLLVNPSKYHEALSVKSGLISLGVNTIKKGLFEDLFLHSDKTKKKMREILALYKKTPPLISDVLKNISPVNRNKCPLCSKEKNKAIKRFPNKSYFCCADCSLLYAVPFHPRKNQYQEAYFFEEYEKQYGKTYLDDFDHIKKLSVKRLQNILSWVKESANLSFLDIGCAYGPFIGAVLDKGHQAQGVEVSEEAAQYVRDRFQVECFCVDVQKDFPSFSQDFDVVSFWYVLEHFSEIGIILMHVNRALKNHGLLCLGLPNSRGISMLKNPSVYLEEHPDDHFTLWNPRSIKKQLLRKGFKVLHIVITGHHPERFPVLGKFKIFHGILKVVSRIFSLGDTFEVYAKKERTL